MDFSGKKILIVEDDEFLVKVLFEKLKSVGFEVEYAKDGQEGLDKFKAFMPDVILLDIVMPVMDGIEATQQIRNEMKLDVPIVALTANALKNDKEKYLNAGMDAYISKPFKQQELLRVISDLKGK